MHKKRTIFITATYTESNSPSNAVAAVQSTERLLPVRAGLRMNACDKLISDLFSVSRLLTPYRAI